jgi:hypothetical protein
MAERANVFEINAYIRPYTVASGQSAYAGQSVIFGSTDTEVQDSGGASDLIVGVCMGPPGTTYAAGDTVQVLHPFAAVARMKVGTGDSTRGKKQKVVSTGVTDADTNGGGTNPIYSVGVALQSGVAGDYIGVGLMLDSRVKT